MRISVDWLCVVKGDGCDLKRLSKGRDFVRFIYPILSGWSHPGDAYVVVIVIVWLAFMAEGSRISCGNLKVRPITRWRDIASTGVCDIRR